MRILSSAWMLQHRRSSARATMALHSAAISLHNQHSLTATFALHSPTLHVLTALTLHGHRNLWRRHSHSTPATNSAKQIANESQAILEKLRKVAEEGLKPQKTLTDSIVEGVTVLHAPVRILVRNASDARDFRIFDFPLSNASAGAASGKGSLDELKTYCKPAHFGRGEENVFDPTYRSALAIDKQRFVTDLLSRSDCEIAERIRSAVFTPKDIEESKQVVFEPVNFNVYGEGGFFKKHRDTPYAQDHFGSLVVCLPSDFEGGALRIETSPDVFRDIPWGASISAADDLSPQLNSSKLNTTRSVKLRWVLFPSYLEHEVLPVTSGNRITVAFNVFLRQPVTAEPLTLRSTPEMDASAEPSTSQVLYSGNQNMLSLMDFMRELKASPHFAPPGTKLGFFCTHLYPLHKKYAAPPVLRGTDAALVHFLQSQMGYNVEVVPVVDTEEESDDEEYDDYDEEEDEEDEDDKDENETADMNSKQIKSNSDKNEKALKMVWQGDKNFYLKAGSFKELKWFGNTLSYHRDERLKPEDAYGAPLESLRNVVWINEWVHSNFGFPYTVLGNDLADGCIYAAIGIIATVPGKA